MNQETNVTLNLEEWKNVLASMEMGIKAIGFPAFVPGGELMTKIKDQLEGSLSQAEKEE